MFKRKKLFIIFCLFFCLFLSFIFINIFFLKNILLLKSIFSASFAYKYNQWVMFFLELFRAYLVDTIIPSIVEHSSSVALCKFINNWFSYLRLREFLYIVNYAGFPGEHVILSSNEILNFKLNVLRFWRIFNLILTPEAKEFIIDFFVNMTPSNVEWVKSEFELPEKQVYLLSEAFSLIKNKTFL